MSMSKSGNSRRHRFQHVQPRAFVSSSFKHLNKSISSGTAASACLLQRKQAGLTCEDASRYAQTKRVTTQLLAHLDATVISPGCAGLSCSFILCPHRHLDSVLTGTHSCSQSVHSQAHALNLLGADMQSSSNWLPVGVTLFWTSCLLSVGVCTAWTFCIGPTVCIRQAISAAKTCHLSLTL